MLYYLIFHHILLYYIVCDTLHCTIYYTMGCKVMLYDIIRISHLMLPNVDVAKSFIFSYVV